MDRQLFNMRFWLVVACTAACSYYLMSSQGLLSQHLTVYDWMFFMGVIFCVAIVFDSFLEILNRISYIRPPGGI